MKRAARRRPSTLAVTDAEYARIFAKVIRLCLNRGWPAHDPDFGGAINEACWAACVGPLIEGRTRQEMAYCYAVRACRNADRDLKRWRRDLTIRPRMESVRTRVVIRRAALDVADEDLLQFVAAHGRGRAAAMLQMHPYTLEELLDEATLRVQRRREREDVVDLCPPLGGGQRVVRSEECCCDGE